MVHSSSGLGARKEPLEIAEVGLPRLRVTPREQVAFIHRMLADKLPVKRAHDELVWRLLEIESGPGFTFRGKTGLGSQDGRAIGWLVGYVERAGRRWIYAILVRSRAGANVEAEMTRLMPLRKSITRALLVRAGVLQGEERSVPCTSPSRVPWPAEDPSRRRPTSWAHARNRTRGPG